MSSSNRYLRPYQPRSNDFNAQFVRAYVAQSDNPEPGSDGKIADPDATLGGLMQSSLNQAFPPVVSTDTTIRAGLPQHSAFIALVIWSLFGFTVPYALCLAGYRFTEQGMLVVGLWCCAVYAVQALLGSLAKEDTTLFFHKLNECWHVAAWFILGWLLCSLRIAGCVPGAIIGVVLDRVISFTSQATPTGSLKAAIRAAALVGLLWSFSVRSVNLKAASDSIWLWYLAGNFILTLPIVWGMQHWFAANRYASRDDVCRYGQGGTLRRISIVRIIRTACAYFAAVLAAVACAGVVQMALSLRLGPRKLDGVTPALPLVGIFAVGILHWAATELLLHHRFPSPRRLTASLYATWRAPAAWLSYQAQFDHPAVFQFKQPFTSSPMRAGMVLGAFWLNTAICASLLSLWSAEFLASRFAEQAAAGPAQQAAVWQRFEVVSQIEYWLPLLATGSLLPPVIFLVSLHAVWGPTLLAFSEHFECFDDQTIPPLLNIPSPPRRRFRRNAGDQT